MCVSTRRPFATYKKIIKNKISNTTQVKTHTVARNPQSQSIKFFYFIISVPSSSIPDDVYDDGNTTTIMMPAIGLIDDAWRRLIILPSLPSLLEHGGRYINDDDNDVDENNNNKKITILRRWITRSTSRANAWLIDRSIENHIESVLSTNFEREQGQSGAHIRRPYTGAEKGKETMLLDWQIMKTMMMMMMMMIRMREHYVHVIGLMCGIPIIWKALSRPLP